ncbi:MAG TPA: hypothetical protein VEQ58_01620 [Polyangiaceae bacterium]|nr:hypothetical protein [Polyangiaceae bacterium]
MLGCGVDDRTLTVGASAAGSSNSSAGTSAGGTASSSAGSGGGGSTNVEIPLCVYDGEVSEECSTLVKNAGFGTDTVPWKPQDGMLGAWEKNDATESDDSGSIRVVNLLHGTSNGFAPGAAVQCIRAEAGRSYDLGADVFITEGQGVGLEGGPYTGKAGIGVYFFSSGDCSGNSIGNADAPLNDAAGAWIHGSTTAVAPEQTQSLSVRLNTLMPFRQFQFEALFDNVLVRER